MTEKQYNAFAEAYNNFSPDPLAGSGIDRFYIDELNQEAEKNIRTAIDISQPKSKILVTGHVGCGKSTVLNKIALEAMEEYHVVSFSVADVLNLSDIETADILAAAFLHLIYSLKGAGLKGFPGVSKNLIKLLKTELQVGSAPGFPLIESIALKINVESESRKIVRRLYETNPGAFNAVLSATLDEIACIVNKDVLMIIDDLDMLTNRSVISLFNEENGLNGIDCKTVFAFSLGDYLSTDFSALSGGYTLEFINIVPLWDIDEKPARPAREMLGRLVHKRIGGEYVSKSALDGLILSSGGLIRDLVDFMRSACAVAINNSAAVIDESVSDAVISKRNSMLRRIFNFGEFRPQIDKVQQTRLINEVVDDAMIQLIKRRFILKYGAEEETAWYRLHPCLLSCISEEP